MPSDERSAMKLTKLLVLFAFIVSTAAVGAAVSVDHDPKVDFTKFKTYSWMPGTPAANPLNETRIHDAIDAQLAAKGLKKVDDGGDLRVVTHASSKDEQRVDVQEYGYYGPAWSAWNRGYSTTSVNVYTVRVGELVVDIFDAESKKVVWRGEASGVVSENADTNAKRISKAVTKLFKNFPPRP